MAFEIKEEEDPTVLRDVLFGFAKIGLIASVAYCQCHASSRIDALEARVRDMSARIEAASAERGNEVILSGKVALALEGIVADDEGRDTEAPCGLVLRNAGGMANAPRVDHGKADAGASAFADPVNHLVGDAGGGDSGEGEIENLGNVHDGHYTANHSGKEAR